MAQPRRCQQLGSPVPLSPAASPPTAGAHQPTRRTAQPHSRRAAVHGSEPEPAPTAAPGVPSASRAPPGRAYITAAAPPTNRRRSQQPPPTTQHCRQRQRSDGPAARHRLPATGATAAPCATSCDSRLPHGTTARHVTLTLRHAAVTFTVVCCCCWRRHWPLSMYASALHSPGQVAQVRSECSDTPTTTARELRPPLPAATDCGNAAVAAAAAAVAARPEHYAARPKHRLQQGLDRAAVTVVRRRGVG